MKKEYQKPEVDVIELYVEPIASETGGTGTEGDHSSYDPWA